MIVVEEKVRTSQVNDTKRGHFLVFSGPSGVGKGTIIRAVLSQRQDTHLAISATTRPPRNTEENGKDYYFLSEDAFKQKIDAGDFVEYCTVHGNYYGTLRSEVDDALNQGQDVIIEIDVQGARKAKKTYAELVGIFIKPPSKADLVQRLTTRNTDPEAVIQRRLAEVETEMAAMPEYDYVVENDNLETAIQDVLNIIDKL